MGIGRLDPRAFARYCIEKARSSFADGDLEKAAEWLELLPPESRPPELLSGLNYAQAKQAARGGHWHDYEKYLRLAFDAEHDPLYQLRRGLCSKRVPLMSDANWTALRSKVDPPRRLVSTMLAPIISGVWSCGAYFSRGSERGAPWSKLLRAAKTFSDDDEDREAVLSLAAEFFCRYAAELTPLLQLVDVVVSVPANPIRYARRLVSLPDQLAQAIQVRLCLPFIFGALESSATDETELKRLSWHERQLAIRRAIKAGNLGIGKGRCVLVVDDVLTSGATLREAGRLLRSAGARDVFAMTLAHTEG